MKSYIVNICISAMLMLCGCSGSSHSAGDIHNHGDEQDMHDDEHGSEIVFTALQAEAAGLEVEEVVRGAFSGVIKTGGRIVSAQEDEVLIVATSTGVVSFAGRSVSEGAAIKAGEAVVTVSSKNIVDGDPIVKAKIAYETAQKEFRRAVELLENSIISVKEYDQIYSNYETAKTVYEAQAANLTADGVKVVSPISGYIREMLVGEGQYVSAGEPVAYVSRGVRLWLRAEVPENSFNELKNISGANFKTAYGKTVYKLSDLNGRLLSFGRTSGAQSFYVPVTFEFDNTGDIISGSYADIYLLSSPSEGVISVPVSAITEEQGLFFVYIQIDDDCYEKQEVALGQNNGERTMILSGLSEGDRVVTKGVYHVKLAAISSVIPEGHSHSH